MAMLNNQRVYIYIIVNVEIIIHFGIRNVWKDQARFYGASSRVRKFHFWSSLHWQRWKGGSQLESL